MFRPIVIALLLFPACILTAEAQEPFSLFDLFQKKQKSAPTTNQENALEEVPAAIPVPINVGALPPSPAPSNIPQVIEVDAVPSAPRSVLRTTESIKQVPQPIRQSELSPAIAPMAVQALQTKGYFGAIVTSAPAGQAGIEVESIYRNSPAQAAGLAAGDRLLSIADSPVSSETELQQLMEVLSPGDRVEIEVYRNRQRLRGLLVIGNRPTNPQSILNSTNPKIAQASANQQIAPGKIAIQKNVKQPYQTPSKTDTSLKKTEPQKLDFQPVPGAQYHQQQPQGSVIERPIMKRLGRTMPIFRRVDGMIDRFSPPPAAIQPTHAPQGNGYNNVPQTHPGYRGQPQPATPQTAPRRLLSPAYPTQPTPAQSVQLQEIIRLQQRQIEIMNKRLQILEKNH